MQVMHALLELLHHHRLNARCSDSGDSGEEPGNIGGEQCHPTQEHTYAVLASLSYKDCRLVQHAWARKGDSAVAAFQMYCNHAGDALAAVFAPLLLPAPLAQECPEAAAALVDTLIGHYRAVFSGAGCVHGSLMIHSFRSDLLLRPVACYLQDCRFCSAVLAVLHALHASCLCPRRLLGAMPQSFLTVLP